MADFCGLCNDLGLVEKNKWCPVEHLTFPFGQRWFDIFPAIDDSADAAMAGLGHADQRPDNRFIVQCHVPTEVH